MKCGRLCAGWNASAQKQAAASAEIVVRRSFTYGFPPPAGAPETFFLSAFVF